MCLAPALALGQKHGQIWNPQACLTCMQIGVPQCNRCLATKLFSFDIGKPGNGWQA